MHVLVTKTRTLKKHRLKCVGKAKKKASTNCSDSNTTTDSDAEWTVHMVWVDKDKM